MRSDEILKLLDTLETTKKSLGFSSAFIELFKAKDIPTDSFNAVSNLESIDKRLEYQFSNNNPNLPSNQAATILTDLYSKLEIPHTALEVFKSIVNQNEYLVDSMKTFTTDLRIPPPIVTQIDNLHYALSSISVELLAFAARDQNWDMLDEFKHVAEHALEFSESLTDEVTDEQQRQFQVLLDLISKFIKKHKQKGIIALGFVEVLFLFYQVFLLLAPKPELATKEDLKQIIIKQDTLIHYIELLNEKSKEVKEYRITNRECDVKLKPKSKISTLTKLPTDFEVIVIQIHHKWVYVSYFDPKDNLPQTGWIMKKYLDKPE